MTDRYRKERRAKRLGRKKVKVNKWDAKMALVQDLSNLVITGKQFNEDVAKYIAPDQFTDLSKVK